MNAAPVEGNSSKGPFSINSNSKLAPKLGEYNNRNLAS